MSTNLIENSKFAFFSKFDTTLSGDGKYTSESWLNLINPEQVRLVAYNSNAALTAISNNCLEIGGTGTTVANTKALLTSKKYFIYDPTKMYKLSMRVKSTLSEVSFGFMGFTSEPVLDLIGSNGQSTNIERFIQGSNGHVVNNLSSVSDTTIYDSVYTCTFPLTPSANYTILSVFISEKVNAHIYNPSIGKTIENPIKIRKEVEYVSPCVFANRTSTGVVDTTTIDYFIVEEYDNLECFIDRGIDLSSAPPDTFYAGSAVDLNKVVYNGIYDISNNLSSYTNFPISLPTTYKTLARLFPAILKCSVSTHGTTINILQEYFNVTPDPPNTVISTGSNFGNSWYRIGRGTNKNNIVWTSWVVTKYNPVEKQLKITQESSIAGATGSFSVAVGGDPEVYIDGCGGGGGGGCGAVYTGSGYAYGSFLSGGGGGGGDSVNRFKLTVTPGQTYTWTVPYGGVASTSLIATAGSGGSLIIKNAASQPVLTILGGAPGGNWWYGSSAGGAGGSGSCLGSVSGTAGQTNGIAGASFYSQLNGAGNGGFSSNGSGIRINGNGGYIRIWQWTEV